MPLPKDGLTKSEYTPADVEEIVRKSDEELNDRVAKAELVAEMSDDERAHYKSLSGEAQESFLFAEASERAAVLKNLDDADPVVYTMTDGTEVRKSAGEFSLKLAKRQDVLLKNQERTTNALENERLSKSVNGDGDYAHLKGDEATRIAIVKATEAIEDETLRENALSALKAKSTELGSALNPVGTSVGGTVPTAGMQKALTGGSAHQQLEAIAKTLRTAEPSLSELDAYIAAGDQNPELYAAAVNE